MFCIRMDEQNVAGSTAGLTVIGARQLCVPSTLLFIHAYISALDSYFPARMLFEWLGRGSG